MGKAIERAGPLKEDDSWSMIVAILAGFQKFFF
jgi:hypothetical protein